jgi:hypothetical protein
MLEIYIGIAPKMGTPSSLGTPGRTLSEETNLDVRKPKSMSSPAAVVTTTDRAMSTTNLWRVSRIMVDVVTKVHVRQGSTYEDDCVKN